MSETLRCPRCGHEIDRANPVCAGCGAKLKVKPLKLPEKRVVKVPKTMEDAKNAPTEGGMGGAGFCTQCGRQLKTGQKFCPECGTAAGVASAERTGRRTGTDRRLDGYATGAGSKSTISLQHLMESALITGVCVCGIMWIAGCAEAVSCVERGMDYFHYRAKLNSMNAISRSGFSFYMDNFTDVLDQQKALEESMKTVEESMKQLRGLFE